MTKEIKKISETDVEISIQLPQPPIPAPIRNRVSLDILKKKEAFQMAQLADTQSDIAQAVALGVKTKDQINPII